jgi:hypothetical protein
LGFQCLTGQAVQLQLRQIALGQAVYFTRKQGPG